MREQFTKTKICPFYERGNCLNGINCCFAHAQHELRPLPNLHKTKLCESVTRNYECKEELCPYAHSRDELRASSELIAYKTSICFFHKKGKCMNGEKCRFAHGSKELKGQEDEDGSDGNTTPSQKAERHRNGFGPRHSGNGLPYYQEHLSGNRSWSPPSYVTSDGSTLGGVVMEESMGTMTIKSECETRHSTHRLKVGRPNNFGNRCPRQSHASNPAASNGPVESSERLISDSVSDFEFNHTRHGSGHTSPSERTRFYVGPRGYDGASGVTTYRGRPLTECPSPHGPCRSAPASPTFQNSRRFLSHPMAVHHKKNTPPQSSRATGKGLTQTDLNSVSDNLRAFTFSRRPDDPLLAWWPDSERPGDWESYGNVISESAKSVPWAECDLAEDSASPGHGPSRQGFPESQNPRHPTSSSRGNSPHRSSSTPPEGAVNMAAYHPTISGNSYFHPNQGCGSSESSPGDYGRTATLPPTWKPMSALKHPITSPSHYHEWDHTPDPKHAPFAAGTHYRCAPFRSPHPVDSTPQGPVSYAPVYQHPTYDQMVPVGYSSDNLSPRFITPNRNPASSPSYADCGYIAVRPGAPWVPVTAAGGGMICSTAPMPSLPHHPMENASYIAYERSPDAFSQSMNYPVGWRGMAPPSRPPALLSSPRYDKYHQPNPAIQTFYPDPSPPSDLGFDTENYSPPPNAVTGEKTTEKTTARAKHRTSDELPMDDDCPSPCSASSAQTASFGASSPSEKVQTIGVDVSAALVKPHSATPNQSADSSGSQAPSAPPAETHAKTTKLTPLKLDTESAELSVEAHQVTNTSETPSTCTSGASKGENRGFSSVDSSSPSSDGSSCSLTAPTLAVTSSCKVMSSHNKQPNWGDFLPCVPEAELLAAQPKFYEE